VASRWPRTIKSGRFAGRTFNSQAEYETARKAAPTAEDQAPDRRPSVSKPIVKYSRPMVEAVVKMVTGGLSLVPIFRGDAAITPEETKWLTDDWFDFGKTHPFFANLIVRMFSVDTYGKLALDHVLIVGARLAPRLPPATLFPLQMAYMARQAMDGQQIDIGLEAVEPLPADDLGMAAGPAPGVDRSNGYGQDLFGAEITDTPAA
jgi:hypothetical protein